MVIADERGKEKETEIWDCRGGWGGEIVRGRREQ